MRFTRRSAIAALVHAAATSPTIALVAQQRPAAPMTPQALRARIE